MFDIGFSELFVIGVVALVVIGPERLPKVARTMGVLFGRLQRYVTQVKSDISREMELAELGKVKSEFESAARSFQTDVESSAAQAERELRDVQTAIDRDLVEEPPPAPEPESSPPPQTPASPQLELGIEETAPGLPAAGSESRA
jgi:sec-independent protein translocase protein TatB